MRARRTACPGSWTLGWAAGLCVTMTTAAVTAASIAQYASGGTSAHDAQNPIANVISLPFQNDTYFETGPYRRRRQ